MTLSFLSLPTNRSNAMINQFYRSFGERVFIGNLLSCRQRVYRSKLNHKISHDFRCDTNLLLDNNRSFRNQAAVSDTHKYIDEWFTSIVKPADFYLNQAAIGKKDKLYFYNIDLNGRVFLGKEKYELISFENYIYNFDSHRIKLLMSSMYVCVYIFF